MTYSLNYMETLPKLFADSMAKNAARDLFYIKRDGVWKKYTYQESRDMIEDAAMGLRSLGYVKGDRVAIQSENRPEWTMTDYACAHFGFVSVAVYPTLIPEQIEYILNDSGTSVVFVSTREQVEKVIGIKGKVPSLRSLVVMDDENFDEDWIMTFAELRAKGAEFKKDKDYTLESEGEKVQKDDLWTLIYTSGTTGNPKGVMLTQFNIASNVQATQAAVHFELNRTFLSFLPLSHSLERMGSHASFWIGSTTWFAEHMLKVIDNLQEARPHYMISVPRLYEKIYAGAQEKMAAGSPLKKKIAAWAMKVGSEASINYLQRNKKPTGMLGIKYGIARKLVFSKITQVFGGNVIFGISGGAPLSKTIGEFFASAGILILEGFGLTETTPVTNVNPIDNIKFGYVGVNIPDVETRIADDGEIWFRGPNIMKGYYNNEAATKEVMDDDGWFATGDIGVVDEEGFLKITDRKKNLIVTSGGKNIAPANIENKLVASRYVDQLVVIGDRRNFLSAVIVPAFEVVAEWARENGIAFDGNEDLVTKPEVYELIEKDLAPRQEELARFEQVKKFVIVSTPFTIDNGFLTPSIKVKRKVVEQAYEKELNALYN